jgi:hypothetical protein
LAPLIVSSETGFISLPPVLLDLGRLKLKTPMRICHLQHYFLILANTIDIENLQNRLLKVCYVPATSTSLPMVSFFFSFLFLLLRPLTVLMKQTRWLKQSLFLDVYGKYQLKCSDNNHRIITYKFQVRNFSRTANLDCFSNIFKMACMKCLDVASLQISHFIVLQQLSFFCLHELA